MTLSLETPPNTSEATVPPLSVLPMPPPADLRPAEVSPSQPPPLPQLVIRVGVTGHRPNQLPAETDAIARAVLRVLTDVRALANRIVSNPRAGYAPGLARLVVVSPLAEGADRIVAEVGKALGFELQAPLPFPAADYANDFVTPESKAQFEELCGGATAVLELDGERGAEVEAEAYRRAGVVTLANCDLLLTIWNEKHKRKVGGTAAMVREALRRRMPIVWVPTTPPHTPAVLPPRWRPGQPGRPLHTLPEILEPQFVQPGHAELYENYFHPVPPARWASRAIAGFRKVMLWRYRTSDEADPGAAEPGIGEEAYEGIRPGLPPQSRWPDYAWADTLAGIYGSKYRSTYIFNYMLGAVAVLFALLSLPDLLHGWRLLGVLPVPTAYAICELAVIVTILALTSLGRRRQWHDRWLNYRLLAEQLRQAELLLPLGRTGPWFRGLADPPSVHADEPWTTWLFRARVRETGLTHGSLTREFLDAYGQRLRAVIHAQREYHYHNRQITHALDHRLHRTGELLFKITLGACLLHLAAPPLDEWAHGAVWVIETVAVVIAAFFPALSAAAAAVTSHGEYRGISRRSHRMSRHLAELERRAEEVRGRSSDKYARIAIPVTQLMTGEVQGWHVMLLERPLSLPA
jgi:hypothetical protein